MTRSDRPTVVPQDSRATTPTPSTAADIADFIAAAKANDPASPRGRLVFALDATMSRQATWDRATDLQARMFEAVGSAGGLDVQLVYFRGFGECRASRFVRDGRSLAALMTKIDCRGGRTQIGRVLGHALATSRDQRVDALVYVGDAMEEAIDELADKAGELALLGTRAFMFQEGRDARAEQAFREIARLTGGAYDRFGEASAERLGDLLRAVARYAAGGLTALEDLGRTDEAARRLISQMR